MKNSGAAATGTEAKTEPGRPRVSIGLPVYNGEEFLAESLNSLLNQTFHDLEVIIGDNASTDGTEEICRQAAAKDSRIRYIRHPENLGAAPNYNHVFHVARGEFFKWAAHDDNCEPTLIEKCVAVLDQNQSVALVAPRTRIIDAVGEKVRDLEGELELLAETPHERIRDFLRFHNSPQACNPVFGLMRHELLGRTNLIDSFPASDMTLLGRLALEGKLVLVPEPLFLRREHPQTSVRANPNWRDRARWFNPRHAGRIQLPYWRWLWEYLSSTRKISERWLERNRCTREVLHWALRQRRPLLRELGGIPASMRT